MEPVIVRHRLAKEVLFKEADGDFFHKCTFHIFFLLLARFLTPTQSSRLYLPLGGDSDPVNLTLSSIPSGRVSQIVTLM